MIFEVHLCTSTLKRVTQKFSKDTEELRSLDVRVFPQLRYVHFLNILNSGCCELFFFHGKYICIQFSTTQNIFTTEIRRQEKKKSDYLTDQVDMKCFLLVLMKWKVVIYFQSLLFPHWFLSFLKAIFRICFALSVLVGELKMCFINTVNF